MTELAYHRMTKPHSLRLTRDEEIEAWRSGDAATLVRSQLAWVVAIAGQISRRYNFPEIELLISAGNVALVQSVQSYDARKSRLTTYVYRRLFWAMKNEIRKAERGVSATQLIRKRKNLKQTRLYGENPPNLPSEQSPFDQAARVEEAGLVRAAIAKLPLREAAIVRQRFYEGMTLAEIALPMGITKERARQIESRAKRLLAELLQGVTE